MNAELLLEYQARAEMFSPATALPIDLGRHAEQRVAVEEPRSTTREERGTDQAVADSFPASDPPPWTPGVARPGPTSGATIALPLPIADADPRPPPARAHADVIIADAGVGGHRTLIQGLGTLLGAIGIALAVPFVISAVGLPIALTVRGVVEAITWLASVFLQ